MPLEIAVKSQRLAANPYHSAWVAASAGSGKTKVLTDRVLNLLLEGCAPERILCLTFTKAAAAEMANRVRARLGEWAILPEIDLRKSLENLQGKTPSLENIERARRLFALTLDTPGGLKIQTIHSFCQSLLKCFPLEADLSPFFEVADDTQQQVLLKRAFHLVMGNPFLNETLSKLILRFNEMTLEEFNHFILQERTAFEKLKPEEIDKAFQTQNVTKEALLKSLLTNIPKNDLRQNLPLFEEGSLTDQARGKALSHFLNFSDEEKLHQYEEYLAIFLTQKGEKRAHLLTQKMALKFPFLKELLDKEALRLESWQERCNALDISEVSKAFLNYSLSFLETYENLKKKQSLLDYEDLILKTVALLKNPGCHWVLYKLDGGLDHILVDEAQDTNPSQWQVIRAIAEEFYANAAGDSRNRTLFIVGDGKQSIYSFQGADPNVFAQMQQDLKTFAQNSGKPWQDINLTVSFRSTPEILSFVNAVFSVCALSSQPLEHLPFRKEAPGHVEVWPLIKEEVEDVLHPWQLPIAQRHPDSPQKRLAEIIAKTIQGWLMGKGPLLKPIVPGDILILVRRRTIFMDTLIRVLKDHNIPVAGVDRLWLLEGLAIQDLLKIAEFLLLPEDDLTLATILKGPLFGLSEEDLFMLAYDRSSTSLWKRLQKNQRFESVTALLNDLLSQVDFLTPYALFSTILGSMGGRKKWHARLGPEVLDSLDEFLNLCLRFQEEETPSLQKFLYWISQEVIELKRDLDQSNQVRVMTVHGSKGLQAPIVFLPDTTQSPLDLPPLDFYEKALVWLPPSLKDVSLTKKLKQKLREKQQDEYRRLLYVALTRAEDALFICGWESTHQDTWYDLTLQGMQKVGQEVEFKNLPHVNLEGKGWRFSSVKESEAAVQKFEKHPPFLLPQWLKKPPSPEIIPTLLRPSEIAEEETFASSSLGEFGKKRGTLIHKLLEMLPNIPKEDQTRAALRFLEKEHIPQEVALEMVQIVQNVLKAYPDFFGPLSQGEVPVIGKLGAFHLSGQIDRIVNTEDHILLIDFKTHSHFPEKIQNIPHSYLKQMSLYRDAMAQIFPQKPILCGLLWTEFLRLDLLPDSLLKKFAPSIDGNEVSAYTKENQA